MPRETILYTRVGDDGYTGVLGRERVPKYDIMPEAYGTVDEASALLGVARTAVRHPRSAEIILEVQRDLYAAMADLATTPEAAERSGVRLGQARVAWLEALTDEIADQVDIPPAFIVAGDSCAGALVDVARTVVRRAERIVAHMHHQALLCNPTVLQYLNRLSSLLFALSRLEDKAAGVEQFTLAKWEKRE
ncbi:MAG: cob(I)yrinic acid a,c-diamide adenosyltransferase [Caldilineales bacterium]|nr:cob(I)yrinic acid a,c-diamide adenosyltransferase [Caldilineales bacterium]MDW8317095.1 cob(I)yrinic acid a,c-diamide adenosyltransferase [Anaerolineae bacterium]